MSECDRYERMISEYVDGELQEPEKTEFESHLRECSRCRRLCDAFRSISLSLGEEAAPAGFTADVMAAVRTRGESGAKTAGKPGKSWPKYLALAACLMLAVLTTVRLGALGGRTSDGAPAAQPAQFGLAAAPKDFDADDTVEDVAGGDAGANDACAPESYDSAPEEKGLCFEPSEVRLLTVSGEAEAELSDTESITAMAEILSCAGEAGDVSGEASYLVSVEFEDGSETIMVWADEGELICSSDGGNLYSAAGSEDELLDAIG